MKKKKKQLGQDSDDPDQSMVVREPMIGYTLTPSLVHFMDISSHQLSGKQYSGKVLTKLQNETGLSAQDMASIVGMSKSKYYELMKADALDARSIDALADFANLWNEGMEAFDGDDERLTEWLHTTNTNLGGIKPVELLSTRMGRRELERAFQRIEYSLYG